MSSSNNDLRQLGYFEKLKEKCLFATTVAKNAWRQRQGGSANPKNVFEVFARYYVYPVSRKVMRPSVVSAPHNTIYFDETHVNLMPGKLEYNDQQAKESKDGISSLSMKSLVNATSYNYLGLSKLDDACMEMLTQVVQTIPCAGWNSSPLVDNCVNDLIRTMLEEAVCTLTGKEACVLTASGYMANAATLGCIIGESTIVIMDEKSHSSIITGFRSGAKVKMMRFKHNCMSDLESKLKQLKEEENEKHEVIVAVEGLYSMEGNIPDLPRLAELKERFKFKLMVDEAHGFYALGKTGKGVCELYGLDSQLVDYHVGTFSKGWAAIGGFFAASQAEIDQIRKNSLYFKSNQVEIPTIVSLRILYSFWVEEHRILSNLDRLQTLVYFMRKQLKQMGFCVLGHEASAIIPVVVYKLSTGKKFIEFCRQRGCGFTMSIYPAAPFFETRIRLCVSSLLTNQDVSNILHTLYEAGVYLKIIKRNENIGRESMILSAAELEIPSNKDIDRYTSRDSLFHVKDHTLSYRASVQSLKEEGITKMQSLIDQVLEQSVKTYPKYDILGLSHCVDGKVAVEALQKYQIGSCGPSLFYGTYDAHLKLQDELKRLYGTAECLVFSSAFNGTISIVSGLAQPLLFGRKHVMMCDEKVNQRIKEGLSKKSRQVELVYFKHNNVEDFELNLNQWVARSRGKLYLTLCLEGIFEETGNIPPLDQYVALLDRLKSLKKRKFAYRLFINEEISLGLLNPIVQGDEIKTWSLLSHYGMEIKDALKCPHIFVGSLSHTLGSQGGFVCSNFGDMCLLMGVNKAYTFSANTPPASAVMALSAMDRMKKDRLDKMESLLQRIQLLRSSSNVITVSENSPIQVVKVDKSDQAMQSFYLTWSNRVQIEWNQEERTLRCVLSNSIDLNILKEFLHELNAAEI